MQRAKTKMPHRVGDGILKKWKIYKLIHGSPKHGFVGSWVGLHLEPIQSKSQGPQQKISNNRQCKYSLGLRLAPFSSVDLVSLSTPENPITHSDATPTLNIFVKIIANHFLVHWNSTEIAFSCVQQQQLHLMLH